MKMLVILQRGRTFLSDLLDWMMVLQIALKAQVMGSSTEVQTETSLVLCLMSPEFLLLARDHVLVV